MGTDRNVKQEAGHKLYFKPNSIISNHGRETFAYLSFQFLLCFACHFFEAIFFFF